jgi:hypothetical protein
VLSPQPIPEDLAPGDQKSRAFDFASIRARIIQNPDDSAFPACYSRLWHEFGEKGEMEEESVVQERLTWAGRVADDGAAMLYEMIWVESHKSDFAAARDHTAIVLPSDRSTPAVVHLSHLLIDPAFRRSGLAGWMRAWPIQTARRCLTSAGLSEHHPIILVGEMEPPAPAHPERLARLIAYQKAGYLMVDPQRIGYQQPDFRPPTVIDSTGGPSPLTMLLILRRVGREQETKISGAELRHLVHALYAMYARAFRQQDMWPLFDQLKQYPADSEMADLLPPTA